ncbi:MAG: hypothetical protein J6A30_00165, partial [Ruminococcus sp.]|nr:hypothetical protein [Ruminococcus sp.]
FSYTYSAKEQEEIKKIREKYVPKEADKMEQLRRLDEGITQKGTAITPVIRFISQRVSLNCDTALDFLNLIQISVHPSF